MCTRRRSYISAGLSVRCRSVVRPELAIRTTPTTTAGGRNIKIMHGIQIQTTQQQSTDSPAQRTQRTQWTTGLNGLNGLNGSPPSVGTEFSAGPGHARPPIVRRRTAAAAAAASTLVDGRHGRESRCLLHLVIRLLVTVHLGSVGCRHAGSVVRGCVGAWVLSGWVFGCRLAETGGRC
jgi:hypothetical protein